MTEYVQLAERLVGVREGHDQDVAGHGGGDCGHRKCGAKQAGQADAAGLQGDCFAVSRQSAEADQEADSERPWGS